METYMEWEEKRFGDVIEFNPTVRLKKGEEYDFIPMANIDPNVKTVFDIERKTYKSGGAKFENGDTLFARITPCLEHGKIVKAKNLKGKAFGSTEYFVFRAIENKSDENFIYYLSKSDVITKPAIMSMVGASGRQRADKGVVENLNIKLPPLPTQQKIASILGAYDDLIENNLKRIQLLEEAAQNLYKEWFVNFKFPNHETHPFDEKTGLPEGWEKIQINDFGEVVTGKTPSTSKEKYYGGKIPFIKTPDMHDKIYVNRTSLYLTEEGSKTQTKKLLPKNSVLVSCIGTAGVVSITMFESQFNQQINAVKFEEDYKPIYFYFLAKGLKKELEALGSSGATMVNVNKGKFEKIKIINPDKEVLISFSKSVELMFKKIENLITSNQQLQEARDLLLPRLMNQDLIV